LAPKFSIAIPRSGISLPLAKNSISDEKRRYIEFAGANDVLYAVEEHIATITLNRPDRMNAIAGDAG
jgi:hypothetical protein